MLISYARSFRRWLHRLANDFKNHPPTHQPAEHPPLQKEPPVPIIHELQVSDTTIDRIKRKSAEESTREHLKDFAETVGLGLVLLYSFFTFLQWRELNTTNINQSAANISQSASAALSLFYTRKQIRVDQRAWLVFDTTYLDHKIDDRIGQPINVPVQIANVGKTPARAIAGIVVVEEIPKGKDPDFNYYPGRPVGHIDAGIIYPAYSQSTTVSPPNAIRHVGKTLTIHGRLIYKDSFGIGHWITFCHQLGATDVKTVKCVAQNSADTDDE